VPKQQAPSNYTTILKANIFQPATTETYLIVVVMMKLQLNLGTPFVWQDFPMFSFLGIRTRFIIGMIEQIRVDREIPF
jgi:hypothetical protein